MINLKMKELIDLARKLINYISIKLRNINV